MIEWEGRPAGTISAWREDERGATYGFIVVPQLRGRGIGRQALRSVCRELFDGGASHVDLEVGVDNDAALRLYTATGFALQGTDDYYELILN